MLSFVYFFSLLTITCFVGTIIQLIKNKIIRIQFIDHHNCQHSLTLVVVSAQWHTFPFIAHRLPFCLIASCPFHRGRNMFNFLSNYSTLFQWRFSSSFVRVQFCRVFSSTGTLYDRLTLSGGWVEGGPLGQCSKCRCMPIMATNKTRVHTWTTAVVVGCAGQGFLSGWCQEGGNAVCVCVFYVADHWNLNGWKMILREGFSTAFWKVHVSFLQKRVEDCWIKIVTVGCGIGDVVVIVHIGGGTKFNKFWEEGLMLVSFNKYVLRPLLECFTLQRSKFSRLYQ